MIRAKVYRRSGAWRVGILTTDPVPHALGRPRRCRTWRQAMRMARKILRILA